MSGQNEVFYWNVEIMLHHQPNSFHDEWKWEADEGVSVQGQFLHCQRWFGVNYIKVKNQLDETERVL